MKALIVSDSHGLIEELQMLKEMYEDKVDVMFHCGDSELSFQDEVLQGYEIVRGNCDYLENRFPDEITKEVGGVRFFVTHGHLYDIKPSLSKISYRAEEVGADVVCFGHSHVRGAEMVGGVLYMNPGSILMPRKYREKTYAILEYVREGVTVQFLDLDHKEVARETFKRRN